MYWSTLPDRDIDYRTNNNDINITVCQAVFSVHFERASLLHMPTHYPGPVHCNSLSNPVRSCASTTGDIGGHWESECSPAFWAGLKSQVVSLHSAHSWANAGVLLGDECIGSGVAFEAI